MKSLILIKLGVLVYIHESMLPTKVCQSEIEVIKTQQILGTYFLCVH